MSVTRKKESILYPFSSLFGDIGGSLGLFVGFSLLTFGESVKVSKSMLSRWVADKENIYQKVYNLNKHILYHIFRENSLKTMEFGYFDPVDMTKKLHILSK